MQPQSMQPGSPIQHQFNQPPQPGAAYDPSSNMVHVATTPVASPVMVVHHVPGQQMPGMAGHIAFSCVVFLCCNFLFGLIAFFIAIAGLSSESVQETKKLAKASLWVNISGIILTVIIVVVVVGLYVGGSVLFFSSL